MAQDISIFGTAVQSKSSTITSENRLNVYFDTQDSPDRAPVAAYGTPGFRLVGEPSEFPARKMYFMQAKNILIVIEGGYIFAFSPTTNPVLAATLSIPGDIVGEVQIADNGNQVLIITNFGGYILTVTGTTTLTYALINISASLPATKPSSCTYLDGYFIVNSQGTQQFYISKLYDGLVWDALDFASAESAPDSLVAVYANNGYLYLLGSLTTEVWVNVGDPLFPFGRIQGSTIQYGLVSIDSLARMNNSIIGLLQDRQGQLSIGTLSGGTFTELSTPDIAYIINAYQDPGLADGFCYSLNGRYFYQITFQTAAKTWLFDFKSGAWSQLASWGLTGSRVRYGCAFNQRFIVSDYLDGKLYQLSADLFTENGQPIVREIIFNQVFAPSQNFTIIARVRAWFETGQGLVNPQAQGYDPTVFLQISRDSGHTWGGYLETNLGKRGEYKARAEWRRLGQARNWALKIRMTDPVKFCLLEMALASGEANK
jgi:hypothetical protein